jgi:hypothetical protein
MNEIESYRSTLQVVEKELKEAGIDGKKPFTVLARLLDAKKMTVDKYGDEHIEEDNTAQAKAVEVVLRLRRLLDNKLDDVRSQTLVVQVSPEDVNRLENITRELKQLQEKLDTDKTQKGKIIDVIPTSGGG